VYVPEEIENITEDIPHENLKQAETEESMKPTIIDPAPEEKPFEIPGLWYALMEKCKTKADVLKVYNDKKETVDAHPELQALLKETQKKLPA
jgi:hypothetical protein